MGCTSAATARKLHRKCQPKRSAKRFRAKALSGIDVHPLDETLGLQAGELLARARKSDVIDASLVLLASDGDAIVTSDAKDLEALARIAGLVLEIIEA